MSPEMKKELEKHVQATIIKLSECKSSQVLEINDWQQVVAADIESIGIQKKRPVIVVIGGASQLSDDIFQQIRGLFVEVLAPIAERLQAVVVDGGTDAGVMRLMGQARTQISGTFPLVGVLPRGLMTLPGEPSQSEQHASLEPNHTHFLLVPGDNWGDESLALAQTATMVSAGAPSIAVMLNGGAITWKDALNNAGEDRLLLVIEGSGRAADELSAVAKGESGSELATTLIKTCLVKVVELTTKNDLIRQQIEAILSCEQ